MYKVVDSKDNILAEFSDFNEAREYAEKKSFQMTVYFCSDYCDYEYPKKEKRPKNGN